MNDIHLIDSCQAYLPMQYTLNLEFIRQKWKKVSRGAKIRNRYNQVPHLTQDTSGKPLDVCFIGGPCSHRLFRYSVLHANQTVDTITY